MLRNLKAELVRNGITTDDVAIACSISRQQVYNYLSESTRLRHVHARIIKEKFFPDLTFEYLFKSDNDKKGTN